MIYLDIQFFVRKMFDKLPIEIQDRIFLQFSPYGSDRTTLQNTRELQSSYVKRSTVYYTVEMTAQYNNLDNMKWLYYHNNYDVNYYPANFVLIRYAIQNSNFEMFRWLADKGIELGNQDFDRAAYYGNLDIMKYMYKKGIKWYYNALTNASIFGNIENIKWLLESGHPYDEKTLIASGEKDHRLESPLIEAVKSNKFEIVKYMYEYGCTYSKDVFKFAARNGNLDIIKYFYHLYRQEDFSNNSTIFANAAKFAACQGDQKHYLKGLENMQWLLDNGITFDKFVFTAVANSINVMKWLYSKGCPYGLNVFKEAAKTPNLETFKWLREINCPWNASIFTGVVNYDMEFSEKMVILKWLYANRCPWNEHTFVAAAINGDLGILEWLNDNRCPWDKYTLYSKATHGSMVSKDKNEFMNAWFTRCNKFYKPAVFKWLTKKFKLLK